MKTTSKSGSAPGRYCWSSRLAYFAARAATTDGNLQGRSEAFGDAWHDHDVLAAFQVHDDARICREVAGLDRASLAVQAERVAGHDSPDRRRALGTRWRCGAQPQ